METLNTILSQLTYDDLDRWAGAKIRTRGKSYIKRVDGLHRTPEGQLVAWVAGTEEYATLVRPNEEGGHAWFCTCSYADGPCKHAVAVLLAAAERVRQKRDIPLLSIDDELHLILFDDRDDITQWHDEEGHEGTGAEAAAKGKPKLHKLLDGKSREELLELLVSLANDYPQVARVLVETEQLRRGQIDLLVRSLRREIQKLTRDPAWSNHWNGERSAPDYTHVCHQFKTLLAAGHADALLALGDELWQQGIEQVEQANDEGETGSAIAECLDIVVQALPQSSMPASAQLLWVIDHLLEDEFGLLHSGEKALENPVYTREDWREVAAVLEKRMGEKSTSRSGSSGTFGRTDLLNFLILAYRQSGWHEKIVPLMEQEVDRLGNYGQLVDVLLAAGDPAQARRWCIHGFGRTIKVAPGTAERLQERLRQIAEAEQRHDLSAAHRAQEFFRRPLLEKYKDLRKAAEKVDCWPVVRAGALGFLETGRRPDLRGTTQEEHMVPAPNITTILYATDLGENTRPVFRLAVSQARRYNARLLMLHVIEPLGSTGTAIIANYLSGEAADKINQDGARDIIEIMKSGLDAFCQDELAAYGLDSDAGDRYPGRQRQPSEEILEVAAKYRADMIVMGKSYHSFLGNALMGTTARRVSRYSKIPVLLVPNTND
jgi:uncharacterized Zn finger protein